MFFATQPLDMKLFIFANQIFRKSWLDQIMPLISSAALLWVIILAATAYGIYKKGPKILIVMLVIIASMGVADFSTGLIKKTIGRVRPVNSLPLTYFREDGQWQRRPLDFKPLKEKGNSYPSAHAANSMAFALMCMFFFRKLRPWMILLPLAVGYSRLYLGKHFPTDVLAGWVVGICVAISVWLIWNNFIKNKIPDKLRL
ncbi:undecaprenyl-diphosphatase [Maridesulfovibrio ferrireducens]|uniref:Undecaprenyl-diphosphatase n=1 Tax=Maridesulfovibrio ferrireducens TaxID=246191 RepID=A0A1G9HBF3_9BACT|nr:phosphatase PAP2 family protein [Maridesulfovibrio ferrireducens]SDL09803.1 undecaprenyl-diphosphatase [Maridesulfovibrio ferrireducens]